MPEIAETLGGQIAEISENQPELIAHHYREAGDAAKEVAYLSFAGDRALSHSALREAHEHIPQALQLISALPDDDIRRRGELKLQTALARTCKNRRATLTGNWARPTSRRASSRNASAIRGCTSQRSTDCGRYHYLSGEPTAMLEQANEFLAFAQCRRKGRDHGRVPPGWNVASDQWIHR